MCIFCGPGGRIRRYARGYLQLLRRYQYSGFANRDLSGVLLIRPAAVSSRADQTGFPLHFCTFIPRMDSMELCSLQEP